MQFDTYASTAGGLGMSGADVPRGEGPASRVKRERSEDDENDRERREDDTYVAEDDTKRFRGDRDEE